MAESYRSNFLWLALDRVVRLAVTVIVGSWAARYLGASIYGDLTYAMSILGVALSIASLGMDGLIVRDLVRAPEKNQAILSATLVLRFVVTLGCVICLNILVYYSKSPSFLSFTTLILGIGAIAQSLEVGELYFQSKSQMSILVIPRIISFVFFNVIKVAAILLEQPPEVFIISTMFENIAGGVITQLLLRVKSGICFTFRMDLVYIRSLIRECWPLAVAGVAVAIYMKSGQILIYNYMGSAASGLYSAGSRLVEVFNFVPMILATSIFPKLVRESQESQERYEALLLDYLRLSSGLGVSLAIILTLMSYPAILILFGDEFIDAFKIMIIYSWTLVFVFLGVARSQHMILVGQTRESLLFTVLGLICSLGFNALLIPIYDANGAALAAVLSYSVSAFFSSFLIPGTYKVGMMQTKAIITPVPSVSLLRGR